MRRTERMKLATLLPLALLAASLAQAQSWSRDYRRHHVTAAAGFTVPGRDLKTYYQTAPAWSFGYGYRPVKYLQFDVGLDGSYNAARVKDYLESPGWGYLRIRDFQTFLPLGGRVVLPVAGGRVEFYGGGGAAYARTAEYLRQPSDWVRLECPDCVARDGWGYYALLGGSVALDRAQHFRLGVTTRVFRTDTSGARVGTTPAVWTADQWVNTYFGLTFSF